MTGLDTETHLGSAILVTTGRNHLLFPKTFGHCLEFLLSQDDKQFCCWNADYDVSAMVKFLQPGILERLFKMEKVAFPETVFGLKTTIKLHYIPRKFLKIKIGARKAVIEIYDLAQFYNCSLEFAAQQEFGEGKSDPGVPWDQLRDVLLGGGLRAKKIVEYGKRDALLVERLAERTREKFDKIGVDFSRPISCASLSYQVFKEELTERRVPIWANHDARDSFRGGMIECLQAGYFPKAYYIDLRSAYPSIIRELTETPSYWIPIKPGERPNELATYASVDCGIHIQPGLHKSPFVFSAGGIINQYRVGRWRLWLDLFSFKEAVRLGYLIHVFGGTQGIGIPGGRTPFKERVEALYLERAKDPQKKWAVKILLNSLYGKMAETKRTRIPLNPELIDDFEALKLMFIGKETYRPHTNFYMASTVTSRVRWRLYHELDPRDVIFYATDGVFLTKEPVGLDFGDALGQWSPSEEVRDLVVVGSGVYTYKYRTKNEEWKTTTRFRGFNSSLNLYELLDTNRHIIPIELQRNQKLGMTVMRQAWEMFNVIHMEERNMDVNFDSKRLWEKKWTARELLQRSFQSEPWATVDDEYLYRPDLKLPKDII
jgi:hypothetical protein